MPACKVYLKVVANPRHNIRRASCIKFKSGGKGSPSLLSPLPSLPSSFSLRVPPPIAFANINFRHINKFGCTAFLRNLVLWLETKSRCQIISKWPNGMLHISQLILLKESQIGKNCIESGFLRRANVVPRLLWSGRECAEKEEMREGGALTNAGRGQR